MSLSDAVQPDLLTACGHKSPIYPPLFGKRKLSGAAELADLVVTGALAAVTRTGLKCIFHSINKYLHTSIPKQLETGSKRFHGISKRARRDIAIIERRLLLSSRADVLLSSSLTTQKPFDFHRCQCRFSSSLNASIKGKYSVRDSASCSARPINIWPPLMQ